MAKVVKNVSFNWTWTGDERLLQGFNVALCKNGETPVTAITASTFIAMRGTSETPVTLNPTYVFSNVLLDEGVYYVPFVQAVYPGDDSEWLASTGVLVEDDGTSTVAMDSSLPVVFFQDSTPSGKFGDTWVDTNDGNKSYYHNGSTWVEGKYGADGVNGTRTAILEMYRASATTPTTFPSGSSTYTWSTGQFTAPATPNSWSLTPPTLAEGETLWICRTVYADTATSATTSITWSANYARAASSNGADGANGARTAVLEVYRWLPTGTSSFTYPSGTSTYTWSTGAFDLPATPNSWSLLPGAATVGYTLFACRVVFTDTLTTATSSVSWTGVTSAYAVGVAGTNGVDAVSGLLTNENHTVAALVTGLGYSLTSSGGTFKVYSGTTDVTTSSTFSISGGTDSGASWTKVQNGLTFTINETTGVYSLSGSSWTTNNESFTILASYSGTTITKVYTISKSLAGAVGEAANVVTVTGEQAFKFLAGSATPVSSNITLTAVLTGSLTTYDWEYWNGSIWANLSGTQNAATYTLAYNNAAWGSATALRVRCLSESVYDEITILKLYDGANGANGVDGGAGQGVVKGLSFLRSVSAPTTPTGGSYASPTATSWSDGIPVDNNQALWMTTRIFTSDGASPQQSTWSTPQKIGTPSTGIRTVFSVLGTTASIGATDATWHVTPAENDNYLATQSSTDNGVTWGAITGKVLIKGEQGVQGETGRNTNNFEDDFLSYDAAEWVSYSGSGEVSVVQDSLAGGGSCLSIGNNVGNDQQWLIHSANIPFDPTAVYKVKVRARQSLGTGVAYFGVAGVATDGSTLVNTVGAATHSSQHYIAGSAIDLPTSFTDYIGYFSGWAATGSGYKPLLSAPGNLHTNCAYFRPMLLVNYNSLAGTSEVDLFSITKLTAEEVSAYLLSTSLKMYKSTTPATPTFGTLANVLDVAVTNANGSVDVKFSWNYTDYTGSNGDQYDIDGFYIYLYNSGTSAPGSAVNLATAITAGTATRYSIPNVAGSSKGFVVKGLSANAYYTFGVKAYRVVDSTVDVVGVKLSALAQPTVITTGEYVWGAWRAAATSDITSTIKSIISGINLPTTGMQTGLNITKDYLGYYDGSAWKSYIDSGGNFKFGDGSTLPGIAWNQAAGTLAIRGALNADDISAGSITGRTLQTEVTASRGIKISSANGFEAFNSSGVKTVGITTAGVATFSGSITGSTITGSVFNTAISGERLKITTTSETFYGTTYTASSILFLDDTSILSGFEPITGSSTIAVIGTLGPKQYATNGQSAIGQGYFTPWTMNADVLTIQSSGVSLNGGIARGIVLNGPYPLKLEPQSTLPTNRAAGSICWHTTYGLCYANGTNWIGWSGSSAIVG